MILTKEMQEMMNGLCMGLVHHLQRLITFLQKRIQESTPEASVPLNTLAPKILTEKKDLDRVQPYLDILKQAIDGEGINNIAVTGSYGSGKSTILRTFENQNTCYKYLNISLASFKDNKDDKDAFERKIEISILQQMFYHVKPSVIPDSRFKRIVNITQGRLLVQTGFLILWILSALTLIKFKYIEKINPSGWKSNYPIDWVALLSTIIFFIGIGFFVKSVYRLLSNSRVSKLNIKGELELGEAVDKSVFNQHLEEILYFFERTDFNVVVIEDVDRFDSTDIFTKLREINILINNSNLIKRPVKFVYAIKDEMFTDKNERVKFFEFIIPIIPFINPSNANEQLSTLITNANLQEVLSLEFTSDVVTFIDDIDMRLLINIFQEYQVYRNILSPSLNQDNLFAIMVYKNLCPHDFGELSKRSGNLYNFLTNKKIYLAEIKSALDVNIEDIDNQIYNLENEVIKNVKELRAIYINNLVAKLPGFHAFYLSKDVSALDVAEDDFFNQIKTSSNITYSKFVHQYGIQYHLNPGVSSGIKFSTIEKDTDNELTYDQRERFLLDNSNDKINTLKQEKTIARNRITELNYLSIQDIFKLVDIGTYLGEFHDSYLMRNLLLNGYIDEHYEDYISLFHEVSLTKSDFSFERSVKGGVSLQFDYQLNKTENLIKRLPEKYFSREAILNYIILEYLLDNELKYKAKLDAFYNSLSLDGEKQFQFIHGFINSKPKKIGFFVKNLISRKSGLWRYIITKSDLPEDQIRNLIKIIFEHADISAILGLEDVDSLVKYFEELPDLFAFCATFKNLNNIKRFISERGIRFKNLDLPTDAQQQLFEFIYTKNHYQINEYNIIAIIEGNKKEYDKQELSSANYTTILKLDLKQLKDYLSLNIEDYISNVIIMLEKNMYESEETVINILNRQDVKLGLKERVLDSQEVLIQSLRDIDDIEVKQLVLSNNSIVASWENVLDYYDIVEEEDFDEFLILFLNDSVNCASLGQSKLKKDTNRDEEYIKKFASKLLYCRELSVEAFTQLLDSLPYSYKSLDLTMFDDEKLSKLLDKNILTLSPDNFKGLRGKGSHLSIRLIEIFQDKLVEQLSELPLETSDWLLVIKSSVITQKNKLSIIQEMDESIIINNGVIADALCNFLPPDCYVPLRYEVLNAMFVANTSIEKRIGLLNIHFENLDDSEIQSLTEKLGIDYAKLFRKQHKPVFSNKDFNLKLFTKLKERGLIIRFDLEERGKTIKVFAKY